MNDATPKLPVNFDSLPQNELTVAHGTIINQYLQKLWLAENLVALPLAYM